VIFVEVPVLRDENCHGLGKRGKGKEKRREREREEKGRTMFCRRGDAPARLCNVLNEMLRSKRWTELTTKGIDG
jgi:hypothetical protein